MKRIYLGSVPFLCLLITAFITLDVRFNSNDDNDDDFVDDYRKTPSVAFQEVIPLHAAEADPVLHGQLKKEKQEEEEEMSDDSNLILGDILLTKDKKRVLEENGHHKNGRRIKRNFISHDVFKWPLGIVPYLIAFDPLRDLIEDTMQYISERSCIEFVPYDATAGHSNRLSFIQDNTISSCASFVGRIPNLQEQEIRMGTGCNNFGEIYHTIAHALGFFHEEQRVDRDQFVTILTENVQPGRENNFNIQNGRTFGVPYDVASIMHSSSTSNSVDGILLTITTKDPLDMPYLGNRVAPTFEDLKELSMAYDCETQAAASCSLNSSICLNDGYLHENCTCICTPQYTGNTCEMEDPTYAPRCIESFTIDDGATGVISSPNYPANYDPNTICQYVITGPTGSTIELHFTAFDLQPAGMTVCQSDYVDVFTTNSTLPDTRSCGSTIPPGVNTTGSQLRVLFISDSTNEYGGFRAEYTINVPASSMVDQAGSCNVSFNSSSGEFTNYVSDSPNNTYCTYQITLPQTQRVGLTLHSFDTEDSHCSFDRIEIYLGDGAPCPVKLCGENTTTEEIISATNTMTVIFVADGSGNVTGFSASYRAVEIVRDAENTSNPDVIGSRRCPGTTNQDERYIQSLKYPLTYPRRKCCGYKITAPPDSHVELTFERNFQIEDQDYILIDLGGGISETVRIKIKGYDAPAGSYISLSNNMTVRFESRKSWFHGGGFRARFRTVTLG